MAGGSSAARLEDAEIERRVRAGTEELLARVGPVAAGSEAWIDQLRAVAYELRDFLREDEARARAMVLEAPHGNAETRRTRERGIALLVALVDRGREGLADPGSVPATTAEIAAGAIYNRIHTGVERGVETLGDGMVRELLYTAVRPYLGVEAALAELERPRKG